MAQPEGQAIQQRPEKGETASNAANKPNFMV
jgi:hypothetical protein